MVGLDKIGCFKADPEDLDSDLVIQCYFNLYKMLHLGISDLKANIWDHLYPTFEVDLA